MRDVIGAKPRPRSFPLTDEEHRERLKETRVQRDAVNGCLLWTGSKKADGYGWVSYRGKLTTAHRLAWTLFVGPIPSGVHVLHRCDVRACCNHDHLFLGSNADNVADMMSKGRHVCLVGEAHGSSKLTEEDVREIRARRSMGQSFRRLGAQFGVYHSTIMDIVNGRTWKHTALTPEG